MFNKKYYTRVLFIVIPLVGGLIFLIYFPFSHDISSYHPLLNMVRSIIVTALIWLGCKAIATYLWEKYPWEKEPAKHLIIEVLAIISYTLIIGFLIYEFEKKFDLVNQERMNIEVQIIVTILITLFITSIHEGIFFYRQWKFNFSKSVRLEKDNLEAKYQTLKAQINPHFLFNSLNSLQSYVEDNHRATEYIRNLSDFLRYVLKSRDREVVLIREEVEILEKYMNLQQMRFGRNLIFQLNIPDNFYHYALPPLVLQMLVENSLKHNIISKDKNLKISVFVENEFIVVENNLQKKNDVESTGQGLANIIERYTYLTNKTVNIQETNSIFRVSVPMVLVDL